MTAGGDRRSTAAERLAARLRAVRDAAVDRASEMPGDGTLSEAHPLARTFGMARAADMLDGVFDARQALARERRETVARMSREGRTVREIAAATGLAYRYVVELRMALGVSRRR